MGEGAYTKWKNIETPLPMSTLSAKTPTIIQDWVMPTHDSRCDSTQECNFMRWVDNHMHQVVHCACVYVCVCVCVQSTNL